MQVRNAVLLVVAVIGCSGDKASGPARDTGVAPDVDDPGPPPLTADLPAGTRSLRLIRTVAVRLGPDEKAKRIGTIAGDTRVAWGKVARGEGCTKTWFAIEPQGWICGDFVEASPQAPGGVELPRLERGELVPGEYGKVKDIGANVYLLPEKASKSGKSDKGEAEKADPEPDAAPELDEPVSSPTGLIKGRPLIGSVNVRKYGEATVGGKKFWKVSQRGDIEYILASAISQHVPSLYRGSRLGDDTGITLPIGFVWPRNGAYQAWTRGAMRGSGILRQIPARAVVPILQEQIEKGVAVGYRINDREWIDAGQVRLVRPAPLPAGIAEGERWIDVDLDLQVLVAYEGSLPVYATLVSTGLKDTPTETGTYRIWKKVSEADMKGLSGEDPYSVATVPWTQWFFPEAGLALHTSYWHDRFGVPKSHGCVNLSPIDARWLYFFTDPQVPPGWSMAAGVVEAPGSIVRVRSAADPNPAVKGYAQKVEPE